MWTRVAVVIATVAIALPLEAQRNCTRGKPCGNTCINVNYTCRVGSTPPPPPAARPAVPAPAEARGLVGGSAAAPPSPQSPTLYGTSLQGTASHCSTSMGSIRDLLIVGDDRPGIVIGRNLLDGAPFAAPITGDTTPAELVAVRCPTMDQAALYVRARGWIVALDARSIPIGSSTYESRFLGNVRVRVGAKVAPAFVWVDPFGVATLRANQGP